MPAPTDTSTASGSATGDTLGRPGAGRHAHGTWTPQVVPGSGGRRHLRDDHPDSGAAPTGDPWSDAAPAVATAAVAVAIPPTGIPVTARASRHPIRYAPVPGAPRRSSFGVWGPPLPA